VSFLITTYYLYIKSDQISNNHPIFNTSDTPSAHQSHPLHRRTFKQLHTNISMKKTEAPVSHQPLIWYTQAILLPKSNHVVFRYHARPIFYAGYVQNPGSHIMSKFWRSRCSGRVNEYVRSHAKATGHIRSEPRVPRLSSRASEIVKFCVTFWPNWFDRRSRDVCFRPMCPVTVQAILQIRNVFCRDIHCAKSSADNLSNAGQSIESRSKSSIGSPSNSGML
jgi:hypothetical protein